MAKSSVRQMGVQVLPLIFFKIANNGTNLLKFFELKLGTSLTSDLLLGSDGNVYMAYNQEGIFKITPSGLISKIFSHPYPGDGPVATKIIEMNGGRLGVVTRLSGSGEVDECK